MTDFESLPDIPESAESDLESSQSGSVDFDDAPFPTQEEAAAIKDNGEKANQLAWIIAIVAVVFLCLCCLGIFAVALLSTQSSNTYINQFLNGVLVQFPLTGIV